MNREILFRGKRKDNGEWFYGNFNIYPNDICEIVAYKMGNSCLESDHCKVIPETIGQYTGLTDKNGKKIFEGDIVNIEYQDTIVENAIIEYIGAGFYASTDYDTWELDNYYSLAVIGTIFDKEVNK